MKKKALLLGSLYALSALSIQATTIRFSKYIDQTQRELIKSDLEYLKAMSFKENADEESLDLFNADSLDGVNLYEWLNERVKFIVSEDGVEKAQLYVATKDKLDYPKNADPAFMHQNFVIPDEEVAEGSESPESTEPNKPASPATPPKKAEIPDVPMVTVMSNIGGAYYLEGKSTEQFILFGFEEEGAPDVDMASVMSPRVGIIQIGKGLFMKNVVSTREADSLVSRLARLGVFFHEARHSDGNGSSLMFGHFRCPFGHPYVGNYACDFNTNGSYMTGALALMEITKNCEECSTKDKTELKATIMDHAQRVLPANYNNIVFDGSSEEPEYVDWDASPEVASLVKTPKFNLFGFNKFLKFLVKR